MSEVDVGSPNPGWPAGARFDLPAGKRAVAEFVAGIDHLDADGENAEQCPDRAVPEIFKNDLIDQSEGG